MLKFVLYIKIIKISEAELDSYWIVGILKCVEIILNIKIKTHKHQKQTSKQKSYSPWLAKQSQEILPE